MGDAQDIEAKAAEWLVRRDAGALDDDAGLVEWLAKGPRHRAAYLRLAAAWDRTTSLRRLRPEGDGIDPNVLSANPRVKRRFRFWIPYALTAGLASLALTGLWWFANDRDAHTYRTEIGGLSRIVLADGSTVTLNTDSELRVRLLPQRREITLIRGEAQFAVAHDANRPFEVSAGDRIVRAVGTAFDVRLDADQALQVIVTDGRVALENTRNTGSAEGKSSAMVSAGESAIAEAGEVTVRRVGTTEVLRRLAWEVGELSFQGETLKDAAAEFNRYNRRKLRIDDPVIAKLQIGGNFQALDVDSFVTAVERSFNVSTETLQDGTILLRGPADKR